MSMPQVVDAAMSFPQEPNNGRQ